MCEIFCLYSFRAESYILQGIEDFTKHVLTELIAQQYPNDLDLWA
jgi:hypothetical protein